MEHLFRLVFVFFSSVLGWFTARFAPTFPLVWIMVFCVYFDVWTAFLLDKRVAVKYPEHAKNKKPKFTSFVFGKPLRVTIPQLFVAICLAYSIDTWVWVFHNLYLAHIATAGICGWCGWSALENSSSCVDEKQSRMWAVLKKIFVDKTQRHLNVDISSLVNNNNNND